MDEELRESNRILEKCLFHKGRIVTPSFIAENNMLPFFQAIEEVIKKRKGPIPFVMLLTRLYNHILTINPQAIVPIARFTFHEHVMDPLYILRNPSTEKGKKITSPPVISSSSSSSDDNKAPPFLEFYDQLSDSEDLTKAQ
nr:hypothetical protein [Tanacetum cinerariifolium]